ncbi:MAG: metal ABC transporter solute-binding protein, Zn/Mn family, partial [Rhizobiaceae bacterium]
MHSTLRLAAILTVITFGSGFAAMAEPIKVVASFSIIGDFAKQVGGERIALTTLVGPNGDAHVYEPKPAAVVAVSQADVVLVNGLHFEGFLGRLVEASGTHATIAELSKGIEPIAIAHEEGEEDHAGHDDANGHDPHHGDTDPHAFQSVANAKIYVQNIAQAFCAADAAGCREYGANAAAYIARLDAVEAEVKDAIASIPAERRVIITSHDAFGYFEKAYGLRMLAPEGISTDAEASAADVAALIMQVKQQKAAAIFVENITNPRLIEQIS